jgi:thiamine biosynthesis lipoprotein
MARKMEIGLVLRVDRDNRIFVSEALNHRLEFVGQRPPVTVVP